MDKEQLRQKLRKVIIGISSEDRITMSRQICGNLISTSEFSQADSVMSFLSTPHEVETADMILCAWQNGKTVSAPKVSWQQQHMICIVINSLDTGFATDNSGIKRPIEGVPIPFEDIDFVITPGIGFDRKGNRLGRGGAYYDRFFRNEKLNAVKCGVCFEAQMVEDVPVTETDVPMDMIVTEKQVYHFNS